MAKVKLKFSEKDAKAVKLAAELSEVKIDEESVTKIGTWILAEADYKQGQQLFEMGMHVPTIQVTNKKSDVKSENE